MALSPINAKAEDVTMEVIRYCEAQGILNERCDLSTIESLRRQTAKEVRTYLAELRSAHGAVFCPKVAGGCGGKMTYDTDAAHYYCPKCKLWLNPDR
jgi:hypothetical protein